MPRSVSRFIDFSKKNTFKRKMKHFNYIPKHLTCHTLKVPRLRFDVHVAVFGYWQTIYYSVTIDTAPSEFSQLLNLTTRFRVPRTTQLLHLVREFCWLNPTVLSSIPGELRHLYMRYDAVQIRRILIITKPTNTVAQLSIKEMLSFPIFFIKCFFDYI